MQSENFIDACLVKVVIELFYTLRGTNRRRSNPALYVLLFNETYY